MLTPNETQLPSFSIVKVKANSLGFFDCGVSKAEYLAEDENRMDSWLENGMHGEMAYLERNREKRYDPTKLVRDAKSVITVLYAYTPQEKLNESDNFKISSYAYGADYHKVIKDKLYQLLLFIEKISGKCNARVFVDSAPVLDRVWAHRSGLGFIGKNTMLINRKGGSFYFIGSIIIDQEFDYQEGIAEKNFCGSCTLCITACPTDALEPFQLDARKCISYLTIENRNEIPVRFKDKFENWIFGCDICQDVCPWNRKVKSHDEPLFLLSDELKSMRKKDWKSLDENAFNKLFEESAVKRAGYDGLMRNIHFIEE